MEICWALFWAHTGSHSWSLLKFQHLLVSLIAALKKLSWCRCFSSLNRFSTVTFHISSYRARFAIFLSKFFIKLFFIDNIDYTQGFVEDVTDVAYTRKVTFIREWTPFFIPDRDIFKFGPLFPRVTKKLEAEDRRIERESLRGKDSFARKRSGREGSFAGKKSGREDSFAGKKSGREDSFNARRPSRAWCEIMEITNMTQISEPPPSPIL